MTPARIMVGSVQLHEGGRIPNEGGQITFTEQKGISLSNERTEAVLVVLEPTQSPREVAETILWALR